MLSYPSHPAVGENVCNSLGGIIFLCHAENLLDVSEHHTLGSLREAETPGLGQQPDPTANKQPGP